MNSAGVDDDLQTIPATARQLGWHPDTLYRLARTGQFPPALKIGSKWLVSVPRLKRFLHGDAAFDPEEAPDREGPFLLTPDS